MALLIFLLSLFPEVIAAPEGYPTTGVSIIYDKQAIIKNDFCFPVVITVNGKDIMVKAGSSHPMNVHKWTAWSWRPGMINGTINSKTVSWPLKGKPKISFGPEEAETHKGENSYGYDFNVPIGTPVYAMEAGKIIRIIQHFLGPHQDKTRMDETNTIEVLHPDGTVARYSHLTPESAKVKLCQDIKEGQLLAESGNVGYSKGPHLHVDIFRPVDGERHRTIPLKFK